MTEVGKYKFVAYVHNYKTGGCDVQLWTQDFRHNGANASFEDRHIAKVFAIKSEHSGLGMTTLANLYCYEENSVTTPA
jgi:hypothetical protein